METEWTTRPESEKLAVGLIDEMIGSHERIEKFFERVTAETHTRPLDWVDHLQIGSDMLPEKLGGYREKDNVLKDQDSVLPPIRISDEGAGIFIKVEDMDIFRAANNIQGKANGPRSARLRKVLVANGENASLFAVDRRGYSGFDVRGEDDTEDYEELLGRLVSRKRRDESGADDLNELSKLLDEYSATLDTGRVADAYFRAERRYWETRNDASMIQFGSQNEMGLGWGNHDHHTFRCSRENYSSTIEILESLGMECRERFYAGDQAGWGAQVLDQPDCGITVFADVDLLPEEKDRDFPHEGLDATGDLGTVGLWVGLHGESMLSAGLHHLAVRVDFQGARKSGDYPVMEPFSHSDFLKQCFTDGERWHVSKEKARRLKEESMIDDGQFGRFVDRGALGSHMELIERNDGFKGFNQTAVSDIIKRTDPRN